MATCPNGHGNADGAAFCASCGAALTSFAPPPPPPPAYGQPAAYGQTYGRQPQNGFGIAALVLGILAALSCSGYLVLSALAIVFGALGIQKANRGEASNKSMAQWGMWLGIAGVVIGVIVVLVFAAQSSNNYRY